MFRRFIANGIVRAENQVNILLRNEITNDFSSRPSRVGSVTVEI